MGDFDEPLMLDILGVLQLPRDVEGDVDGRGTDGEGGGDVALQGVAHHEQLRWEDVEMLAELLELDFGLVRRNLHVGEILRQSAAVELVLLVLQLSLREDNETVGISLQALQGLFDFG